MKNAKRLALVFVLLLAAIALSGCTSAAQKGTIKIGVLGDLTGQLASYFEGIPNGARLAAEDLEKETGKKIELIVEDQKSCDPKETVTAMRKLVDIDAVDFVLGGSCSSTTLAAAPIANSSKTIMVSPASSAPSVSNAGEYVFRTYIADSLRAKEAARLAFSLGKRKMALIFSNSNDAAVEINKATKEEFQRLGGKIVAEEGTVKTDSDFRTQLAKIKAAEPDVFAINIHIPQQIGLVAKQAKELGLEVQLIVPFESAEDKETIDAGGDAVEGLIYVMPGNPPETEGYKALSARYKEKFGKEMPQYTTEAYDAIMLGVTAVLASNGTKEDTKNKLFEASKSYQGVSGNVAFDEKGDVAKPVIFKQIKSGKFAVYEQGK